MIVIKYFKTIQLDMKIIQCKDETINLLFSYVHIYISCIIYKFYFTILLQKFYNYKYKMYHYKVITKLLLRLSTYK